MTQLISNNGRALLTAGILAADTSIAIEVAKADSFPVANTNADPVPTVGKDYFKAVLQKDTGEIEIIYVRTRASGVAIFSNVIRGQEGTTALDFLAGSVAGLRVTALDHQKAIELSVDATVAGKSVLNAATAAAARTALGVAPRATRIDVASVAGTVDLTTAAPDCDDIQLTGALQITKFLLAVGRVVRVRASGLSSVAANADIVTQTGRKIYFRAGSTFELRATAANVVEVLAVVGEIKSMHRLNTGNGFGSTNTKIRRWLNVVTSQGNDVTYADSATLGASFTIESPGVYGITYADNTSVDTGVGLSLNSSQLTTNINDIAVADRLTYGYAPIGSNPFSVHWSGYLVAGDVVRPHSVGGSVGIASRSDFTITKLS